MVQHTAPVSESRQSTSDLPPALGFTWNREECADQPFNLSATLASGQNFRWRRDAQGVWWGAVESTVVAAWQAGGQPDSPLHWQTFPRRDQRPLVRDYFRLDVALLDLYTAWIRAEPRMTEAVTAFRGLRVLRQPPQECLFAFQCAACNTVVKIERSVTHLAAHYGQPIALNREGENRDREGENREEKTNREVGLSAPLTSSSMVSGPTFYAFPTLDALANADASVLRAGLWGYRAPRVIALARHLQTRPADWLISLRQQPYADAHAALTNLFGIGAKLADCICLFALDKDAAVPVDTHIRQIAVRLFAPDLAGKSLTPRLYNALAETYHSRFGDYAGWAQQYLFFAELHRAPDYKCE